MPYDSELRGFNEFLDIKKDRHINKNNSSLLVYCL